MDIREVLPPAQLEGMVAHYGIVSKSAADFTALVPVILPEFDENLEWGPCRWQARDPVSLPVAGDECLVLFDNRRDPWIVAWWPF